MPSNLTTFVCAPYCRSVICGSDYRPGAIFPNTDDFPVPAGGERVICHHPSIRHCRCLQRPTKVRVCVCVGCRHFSGPKSENSGPERRWGGESGSKGLRFNVRVHKVVLFLYDPTVFFSHLQRGNSKCFPVDRGHRAVPGDLLSEVAAGEDAAAAPPEISSLALSPGEHDTTVAVAPSSASMAGTADLFEGHPAHCEERGVDGALWVLPSCFRWAATMPNLP